MARAQILAGWMATLAVTAACKKGDSSDDDGGVTAPTKVDAPKPSSDGAVAAIGKHLLWIEGTTGMPDRLVRRFTPGTKTWEEMPLAKEKRLHVAAATVGDTVLAVGGMANVGRHSGAIEAYDPNTHRWQVTGQIPTAVSSMAMAAVGDVAYVFGGNYVLNASMQNFDTESVPHAYALHDRGKTVKKIAPMPTPREEACAVAVDTKIYVMGGRTSFRGDDSAIPSRTSAVEIYDTTSDAWTEGPSLPRGNAGSCARLGDHIVLFGGGALEPDRPHIFDLKKGEWSEGEPRDDDIVGDTVEGAAVLDGTMYLITQKLQGIGSPSIPVVVTYDPAKDAWSVVK